MTSYITARQTSQRKIAKLSAAFPPSLRVRAVILEKTKCCQRSPSRPAQVSSAAAESPCRRRFGHGSGGIQNTWQSKSDVGGRLWRRRERRREAPTFGSCCRGTNTPSDSPKEFYKAGLSTELRLSYFESGGFLGTFFNI